MATLAEVLRQAGYVTSQGQVVGPRTDLAQKLKSYVMNIPQNAAQNLANQRADIDAALTMGDKGIQIGDRAAFERQMAEVPNLMGSTTPLSKKQFEKMYSQHIDMRNRQDQLGEERLKSIIEEGFKQGFGLNTLPIYKGGEPKNIIDKVYSPQKGDFVYLVPNEFTEKISSGAKVKGNWKPKEYEVLRIKENYPSLYEEYLKYFKK